MVIAKLIRLCLGIVKNILKAVAVLILCLVVLSLIPNLPPYIEYNAFNVTPPVPLEGALSINTLLNNAEQLYEGMLKGPEAFDVYNGVLYTGLHGGEIVKFVDGKLVPVAKFGQPCEGIWEEKQCGRPLGIKFGRDGFLYVADAYYGLFKVNVNDGTKIQLVSVTDLIKDKPVKFPNSVDVAEDGTVYWTISSTQFNLEDGVFDMLADGSGRLLRYDPKKKTNEVLIDNLHFANGVVLSSNEEFVLVAETARSRVHRYYLKGPKKGVHDIFLDGLPGLPDNLKSDGRSGFFVPLVVGTDSSNPILFQILGPFPSIRKALSRFLALWELLFLQIDSVYPNYYAKRAIHYIGHFESLHGIGPKRITILHVDENGKIKSSYHSTDGKLTGISEIQWFNGAFYLGSPYNTYVGRIVLDVPELHNQKGVPVKEEPLLKKQAQDQGQLKKQTKQEQAKPVTTEQKLSEPTIQQKHSTQDKKPIGSDIHQHKQMLKEEKVHVKQKEEKKEQSKPVQQTKQPVQQQKEQPKVQTTPQKKNIKEEKAPVQQKPDLQQSKKTVNERRPSPSQEKPQPAAPKPPVQQQKQQPAEAPKAATHQQKQQQQQQRPVEVPKPTPHQQKQQQQQATKVPKSPSQQQKKQSGEPAVEQQRQQQRTAEIPKSAAPQQKHSTDVPKPAAQQQKQQEQKLEVKQEKELHEKKTVPQQKPQAKETKPQVQQQKKVVKEEAPPMQQKEQLVKHKPTVQQQKSQPQENKSQKQQQQQVKKEQPIIQQQKKTAGQKAANQQEPVTVQKASVQQPVQAKKSTQEKSSPQQEQPSETSHQKPKVQDKVSTKEQHPPK